MTLIKSISGIRGTIGGKVGEGLSLLIRFVLQLHMVVGYKIDVKNSLLMSL